MTENLVVKSVFNSKDRFPVYCHYVGQFEPQRAYISLDIENGEVDACYNSDIGNCKTAKVWNRLELHFDINPYTFTDKIADLISENMDKFQAILDGSEIVWNGSNYIGKFDDDAEKIIEKFDFERALYDFVDVVMFQDLKDFSDEMWFSKETQTLTELATDIYETGNDAGYWSDELDSVDAIEYEILHYWLECLYNNDVIPKKEAKLLISDSRVDISDKWLTEINEFASD